MAEETPVLTVELIDEVTRRIRRNEIEFPIFAPTVPLPDDNGGYIPTRCVVVPAAEGSEAVKIFKEAVDG